MKAAALAFALSALAAAASASSVEAVFEEISRLYALQDNKDARQIALLDRQCQALAPKALKEGWKSVAPLAAILEDASRPVKIRLLAASFLGLSADPLAFPPLRRILDDPRQDAALRSSAALSLPGLGLSKAAQRQALCPVLAEQNLPESVLTSVLIGVERLGCEEPALLEPLVKNARGDNARRALTALSGSPPPSAALLIWNLTRNSPAGWPLRKQAQEALKLRRADLALFRLEP